MLVIKAKGVLHKHIVGSSLHHIHPRILRSVFKQRFPTVRSLHHDMVHLRNVFWLLYLKVAIEVVDDFQELEAWVNRIGSESPQIANGRITGDHVACVEGNQWVIVIITVDHMIKVRSLRDHI